MLALCDGPAALPESTVAAWAELILRRAAILGGCSVLFLQVFTPTRIGVFPEHFPLPSACPGQAPSTRIAQAAAQSGLRSRVLDLGARLREDAGKAALADPADPGWAGPAWPASAEHILQALAATGVSAPAEQPPAESAVLDANEIGRALLDRSREGIIQVQTGARLVLGHAAPEDWTRVLVIFDDGFLFAAPRALFSVLSRRFSEVHLVCSRDIDFSYVARVDGGVVIASVSERSVSPVPTDQWDISVVEWHYREALRLAAR